MPLDKDFDRIDEIDWSPELPIISSFLQENSSESSIGNHDFYRPLESNNDIAMKLLCSYLK